MTPEILKPLIEIANGQQGLKTDLDGFLPVEEASRHTEPVGSEGRGSTQCVLLCQSELPQALKKRARHIPPHQPLDW